MKADSTQLPPSLRGLEVIGCHRLSYARVRGVCDALGGADGGASNVRCDDGWIHQVEFARELVSARVERFDTQATESFEFLKDQNLVKFL